MTRKKRGCLVMLVVVALVVTAGVIGVSTFLPGDLQFGGSAPVATATQPGASAVPAAVPAPAPAPSAWMTYVIPNDILQAELKKSFPIHMNVVDMVKLQIDKPVFVADQDGAFLRIRLAVDARVLEGSQSLPGMATVRTQLGYDRAARKVRLRNAELVELAFPSVQGAAALQPVLAQALAAEMEGYVIFEVPEDGLWWLKTGIGFVRDVYVKEGRVAVGLGP